MKNYPIILSKYDIEILDIDSLKKENINIFLDDIRLAPVHYDYCFKNAEDLLSFIEKVSSLSINTLSLDHDLGLDVKDGYDFVKEFSTLDIPVKRIQFHTDNMIGFRNMYMYLKNAQSNNLISSDTIIEHRKIMTIDGEETISYSPKLR